MEQARGETDKLARMKEHGQRVKEEKERKERLEAEAAVDPGVLSTR